MIIDCPRHPHMSLNDWFKEIIMTLMCAHPLDPNVKKLYNNYYNKYRMQMREEWTILPDNICYAMIADINPEYLKYRHIKR